MAKSKKRCCYCDSKSVIKQRGKFWFCMEHWRQTTSEGFKQTKLIEKKDE